MSISEIRNVWLRRAALIASVPFVVIVWLAVAGLAACVEFGRTITDEFRGKDGIPARIAASWRR